MMACMSDTSSLLMQMQIPSNGFDINCDNSFDICLITWGDKFSTFDELYNKSMNLLTKYNWLNKITLTDAIMISLICIRIW